MEISTELKDRILSECKKMLPKAEEVMLGKKFTTKFMELPILIDGVIDSLRYNVEEKRFDRIGIYIATEGIANHPPPAILKMAIYCDKAEMIYIDI